jgi:uncharacterized membrane protein
MLILGICYHYPMLIFQIRQILKQIKVVLGWVYTNPATVFLVLATFFGLIFIFKMSPLAGTDEFTHFPRVYQIQQGTFWEQRLPDHEYGGYLPGNITSMINDFRDLSRNGNNQSYTYQKHELEVKYSSIHQPGQRLLQTDFTSTVTYPPWAYAPSVIGVRFARALALPLTWYVYLGRFCTLLVWVILSWWSIKLFPKCKWFVVAVALLPTSLTQAATIGADGLVNGLSWLIIALVLSTLAKSEVITKRRLLILLITSLWLCVIKDGYWLIAAMPFILPINRFASCLQAYIWRAVMALVLGTTSLLFAIRTSHVANTTVLTPRLGEYINSHEQMHYVVSHFPLFIGRVLIQPFTKNYDTVYQGIVGIVTNRLIYLSIPIMGLLFASLFMTLNNTESVPALKEYKQRLLVTAFIIILGTYILLALAFYLGNTAVGSPSVFGMGGRYFLPLLPILAVFPLTRNKVITEQAGVTAISSLIIILSLVSTALSIS